MPGTGQIGGAWRRPGGFAVVDVGNDGHVSDVVSSLHGFLSADRRGGPVSRSRTAGRVAVECSITIRQRL